MKEKEKDEGRGVYWKKRKRRGEKRREEERSDGDSLNLSSFPLGIDINLLIIMDFFLEI